MARITTICGMSKASAWIFALTYVGYATFYFDRKPLTVAKSQMTLPDAFGAESSLSMHVLSVLDTGFLASYAAAQLALAPLAGRTESSLGLLVLFGGSALCCALLALAHSQWLLLLLWSANGGFQALAYPLCVKALNPHVEPSVRGRVMGLWTTCQSAGSVLANVVAAYAMHRYGWRAAFAVPAAFVAAAGLALYRFLPADGASSGGGGGKGGKGLGPVALESIRYKILEDPSCCSEFFM